MADDIDNSNISMGSGHNMQLDNQPLFLERLRMPKSTQEKYKATSFPIMSLKIGSWKKHSKYEGEMEAKCYYSTKKIVWEVLENDLKSKMEIQFSDIDAMKATMIENQPGTLELLLNGPPLFYRERDPIPKKQTVWYDSSDFTQGQASIVRIHFITFPPGALDKHYETLLQCDHRLMNISKEMFPESQPPYFQPNNSNTSNNQFGYDNLNTTNIQFGYDNWNNSNIQFDYSLLPQSQPTLAMSFPFPQIFPLHSDQTNYNLPLQYAQTNNLHVMHPNSIQIHNPPSQNQGMNYHQSNNIFTGNNSGHTIETYGASNTLPMNDQVPFVQNVMPSIQEESVQFNGIVHDTKTILRNIEQHLFSDSSMVDFSDESLLHNESI